MLVDCFLYFNERDLLKTRLNYLGPYVDQFIIIESTIDFAGNPRKIQLNSDIINSLPYSNKIKVYIWDPCVILKKYIFPLANFFSIKNVLWKIQHLQRNHFLKALKTYQDNDIIIFGDLDEFPDGSSLYDITRNSYIISGCIGGFKQTMFYYDLQHIVDYDWKGTAICNLKTLKKITPNIVRKNRYKHKTIGKGWHFSYFGSSEMLKEKINAIAKAEKMSFALNLNIKDIQKKLINKEDMYNRKDIKILVTEKKDIPDELLFYFKSL